MTMTQAETLRVLERLTEAHHWIAVALLAGPDDLFGRESARECARHDLEEAARVLGEAGDDYRLSDVRRALFYLTAEGYGPSPALLGVVYRQVRSFSYRARENKRLETNHD